MKTSLVIGLGALLLSSTAALAQEEKVLNLFNWSDYRAEDTLDPVLAVYDAADEGFGRLLQDLPVVGAEGLAFGVSLIARGAELHQG